MSLKNYFFIWVIFFSSIVSHSEGVLKDPLNLSLPGIEGCSRLNIGNSSGPMVFSPIVFNNTGECLIHYSNPNNKQALVALASQFKIYDTSNLNINLICEKLMESSTNLREAFHDSDTKETIPAIVSAKDSSNTAYGTSEEVYWSWVKEIRLALEKASGNSDKQNIKFGVKLEAELGRYIKNFMGHVALDMNYKKSGVNGEEVTDTGYVLHLESSPKSQLFLGKDSLFSGIEGFLDIVQDDSESLKRDKEAIYFGGGYRIYFGAIEEKEKSIKFTVALGREEIDYEDPNLGDQNRNVISLGVNGQYDDFKYSGRYVCNIDDLDQCRLSPTLKYIIGKNELAGFNVNTEIIYEFTHDTDPVGDRASTDSLVLVEFVLTPKK